MNTIFIKLKLSRNILVHETKYDSLRFPELHISSYKGLPLLQPAHVVESQKSFLDVEDLKPEQMLIVNLSMSF